MLEQNSMPHDFIPPLIIKKNCCGLIKVTYGFIVFVTVGLTVMLEPLILLHLRGKFCIVIMSDGGGDCCD